MPFLSEVLMTRAFRGRGQLHKFTNYHPRKVYDPQTVIADKVKNVAEKKNLKICIQEMSEMLACFKKHEFSEQLCSKEIQGYKKCLATQKERQQKKAEMADKGTYKQSGRLPPRQLNTLLARFPNPAGKS